MPSREALLAAYYKFHDPTLTQREIAEKANLGTQAQVSRLLAEAREKEVLREIFQFPAGLDKEVRQQIESSFFQRHSALENALAQKARDLNDTRSDGGSFFKRLHVVGAPGLEEENNAAAREKAFQVFGAGAAEIVTGYIDQADTCCVAWGRTIDATVRHVRPRSTSGSAKLFIPIAGEPTNHEPNGVSPSDAARTLAQAWPESRALSLRGVQARIPKSVYVHDQDRIARELVGYSKNYRQIFGGPGSADRPLIRQVPMILTGIGDVTTSKRPIVGVGRPDPWYLETEDAEDPSVLGLAEGNIGGVWIARSDVSAEEKKQVDEVNARWLGAQHDDFKRCSRTADMERNRPGVVVLAVEPEKKNIVLEALYLVNVLVVSRQLADALADELLS
ncbi:sugar-binding domain-containing protein [Trebonia sp.]|uniref:sugar-binding domain-containing protein n=1 Tax=Trebonia sp. TaxID=2767075 RepID=UPI00261B15F2|nr:sugar-binding domain-containing protein [Trebonia sp.]